MTLIGILIAVLLGIIVWLNHRANKAQQRALELEQRQRYQEYNQYRKTRDTDLKELEREFYDKLAKAIVFIPAADLDLDDDDDSGDGPKGNA